MIARLVKLHIIKRVEITIVREKKHAAKPW